MGDYTYIIRTHVLHQGTMHLIHNVRRPKDYFREKNPNYKDVIVIVIIFVIVFLD